MQVYDAYRGNPIREWPPRKIVAAAAIKKEVTFEDEVVAEAEELKEIHSEPMWRKNTEKYDLKDDVEPPRFDVVCYGCGLPDNL